MSIKYLLTRLVEKITGRKCRRCKHNCNGRCCHPNGNMFMRCWNSITRPGFERRPGKYEKTDQELTEEQVYQLAKIQAVLQEAGETARDGGLVEE